MMNAIYGRDYRFYRDNNSMVGYSSQQQQRYGEIHQSTVWYGMVVVERQKREGWCMCEEL